MTSHPKAIARLVFVDLLGSIALFPVWWYSKGFLHVLGSARAAVNYRYRSYGFTVWLKNFFNPMYGQHDLAGRLISVFMRFVVLVGRAVALLAESFVYAAGLILWLIAPPLFFILGLASFAQGAFIDQVGGLIG